jgi:NADH-quinone oxidoreductase subunit L
MTADTLLNLALYTLFLPLAGFLILVFFGKRLPRDGDWFGTGILGLALLFSLVILFSKLTIYPEETLVGAFTWIDFGDVPFIGPISIDLGIMLDNLSTIMLVVVCIVSFLVHLFSIGYMQGDVRYSLYFAYLGIFSFSMFGIVIAHNFLMMYVFWELVGLSSYLLIGHWYEKKSASDAAKKAFIVNRIGDFGMFIGILILFTTFSTFTFETIFSSIGIGVIPFGSEGWLTAAGILIFCGAIGKSAQFPLHVWLPDAMEGPTPVSALIHAATMVAAGVYLIARTYALMTADALMVIVYIGAITAVIGATIAITQFDIKKVLAYSTVSQLGYMVMALGAGAFTAGFFHLVTHASFKAGLFLGSGSVIHAMHHALHKKHDNLTDPQDIRNMGGLKRKMPVTYWTFLIFTLAISGVPLTSGFLSKDEILAGTLAFGNLTGHYLIPLIAFLVAGLTAFYMFRLVFLTFHGDHADASRIKDIHESSAVMTIPLVVFAVLSIFVFYSFNPIGAASGWFYQAIERPMSVVPVAVQAASTHVFEEALHHAHTLAMILSVLIAGLGILLSYVVYRMKKIDPDKVSASIQPLYNLSYNKWYFDELYDKTAVSGILGLSKASAWFDDYIIDGIVNGAATITRWFSAFSGKFDNIVIDGLVNFSAYFTGFSGLIVRKFQTGKVQTYIIFVILSIIVFFFVFRTY